MPALRQGWTPNSNCWTLHPDQISWKKTGSVEHDGEIETEREIGQLEVLDPHGRDERKCVDAKVVKCIDAKTEECIDAKIEHIWSTGASTRRWTRPRGRGRPGE